MLSSSESDVASAIEAAMFTQIITYCQDWRENEVCTFVTYHCRRRFVNDVTVGGSRCNKDNVQTHCFSNLRLSRYLPC